MPKIKSFSRFFVVLALALPFISIPAFAADEGSVPVSAIGTISIIYGAIAVLSLLLLFAYIIWEKNKERNFLYLFICVSITNCGYFFLSISKTLFWAMIANRMSYFGAAYSILVMLLIIYDVCKMELRRWFKPLAFAISTAAFLIACSGELLGLYYSSVTIESVHGVTKLCKEYGPLHSLYSLYIVAYVVAMVFLIGYASKKKRLASPKYAIFLATAVLLNVCVWAVEQLLTEDFELLSVSYIVTEIMLLTIYGVLRDYGIIQPNQGLLSVQMLTQLNTRHVNPGELPPAMEELFKAFSEKAKTLSSAEHRILKYYIDGYDTADIPELAFVSIHTVKKHNHSIYQKLNVSSRDELMLYIELFRCCGWLDKLSDEQI
ncbi:MAG: hypothetical protein E7420_08505 [Ruminococcaceae bacterium]|nr:hypothetical protein [Oscillospiraceae bacterium]